MNLLPAAPLLLFWTAPVNAVEPGCQLTLGPVVPDAATARTIARAVIAARQPAEVSKKYHLIVEADPERTGSWIAFQSLPQSRNHNSKSITVIMGGGGISMRVDGCTGEISDMYYQR